MAKSAQEFQQQQQQQQQQLQKQHTSDMMQLKERLEAQNSEKDYNLKIMQLKFDEEMQLLQQERATAESEIQRLRDELNHAATIRRAQLSGSRSLFFLLLLCA